MHPRAFDRPARLSPTADPRHVYHDVLISIDDARGLNNGLPSLWAYYFDHLNLRPGQTVLQVGAGVGYFTAILAHLVGPHGRVLAYEVDKALAARAAENLSSYSQVDVVAGDAVLADDLPELDTVAVFAGATHVPPRWLALMNPAGRIAIPLTAADQWGFMLLLERQGEAFAATSLGRCGFYPCASARREDEASALGKAMAANGGVAPSLCFYEQMPTAEDRSIWYAGAGFCLTRAVPA